MQSQQQNMACGARGGVRGGGGRGKKGIMVLVAVAPQDMCFENVAKEVARDVETDKNENWFRFFE